MGNLPDIRKQLSGRDLFNAFKLQLIKDFSKNAVSADFVAALEPNYDRIHDAIALELRNNSRKPGFNLQQLLYSIDISEAQLAKYSDKQPSEDHFSVIAELIIKRVLQKVVLKQYYKNADRP